MIAIKGMEMPKNCWDCPILLKENGQCEVSNKYIYENDIPKDCPLVEMEERKQWEINWIPLIWDEYPTVDMDGNDDYVYAVDYSVPMPKEDEWVLITDENHNVRVVQYDGYDFGDYVREHILAWAPSPMPYKD